jgi:hypothetical protein
MIAEHELIVTVLEYMVLRKWNGEM